MASGLVLLDKPQGITSHDLVYRLRRGLGTKKIGHAGTLDPMATGLMILGVNQGTKLMQFLSGLDKTYEATITLGLTTSTDDAEGDPLGRSDASLLTVEQIDAELENLRGEIEQVPASVSAIRTGGKRAYELVREGKEVNLAARKVRIDRFERVGDLSCEDGLLSFHAVVDCSSGTYVRSLARDLGRALGVGGHLSTLRRTRVGPFEISDAGRDPNSAKLIPMAEALQQIMATFEVSEQQATDLSHGKRISIPVSTPTACLIGERVVAIVDSTGKILVGFPQESDA